MFESCVFLIYVLCSTSLKQTTSTVRAVENYVSQHIAAGNYSNWYSTGETILAAFHLLKQLLGNHVRLCPMTLVFQYRLGRLVVGLTFGLLL